MTEPYYQDAFVTLYHGDAREVPEWLDGDVLVTDPPYGRAWRSGALHGARRPGGHPRWSSDERKGITGDKTTAVRDAALDLWGDRPAVVFGDLMLAPPAGTKQVLVYAKPSDTGFRGAIAGFRRDAEAIYLMGMRHEHLGGTTSILTTGARISGSNYGLSARAGGHPHAKPLDVMQQLIQHCPEGTIADPFVGSGTTLLAAKLLGRKAIGVEIDEKFCVMAAHRLGQFAFPLEATS